MKYKPFRTAGGLIATVVGIRFLQDRYVTTAPAEATAAGAPIIGRAATQTWRPKYNRLVARYEAGEQLTEEDLRWLAERGYFG